jgi:Mg2+/Co2+ transporter CorC
MLLEVQMTAKAADITRMQIMIAREKCFVTERTYQISVVDIAIFKAAHYRFSATVCEPSSRLLPR